MFSRNVLAGQKAPIDPDERLEFEQKLIADGLDFLKAERSRLEWRQSDLDDEMRVIDESITRLRTSVQRRCELSPQKVVF